MLIPSNSSNVSVGEDENSINSSDEALFDMLGIPQGALGDANIDLNSDEEVNMDKAMSSNTKSQLPSITDEQLMILAESNNFPSMYQRDSVCIIPSRYSIPAEYMRRLTDELVWGGSHVQADKTYETVHLHSRKIDDNNNNATIYPKKVLTRLEHFVDAHSGWSDLCHGYLRRLVSHAIGVPMVLYKEKLNIKPSGGSGFAPHLDTPSLRIALGKDGPQTFCTVMVAIDDMTVTNGCLRVCKGSWNENNHVDTILPEVDGNPDAGGRAGAIPLEKANDDSFLQFEPLVCRGGSIAIFNGWMPHRSAANTSPFPRRAVFLTYNPEEEGDFHQQYYEKMEERRQQWRDSVGLNSERIKQQKEDELFEMQALATVPTK